MEIEKNATIQENGGIDIPEEILSKIGSELRYSIINGVLLLILKATEKRFPGDMLASCGSTYYLPEHILSEMQLHRGDRVQLVYSEVLEFIVGTKIKPTDGR